MVTGRNGATLLIDGRWEGAETTFTTVDPSSLHKQTGEYAEATAAQVRSAFVAATRAQHAWAGLSTTSRAAVLNRLAELMEDRASELAGRLTADMGKTIKDTRAEVARSASVFRYFAAEAAQSAGEVFPASTTDTMLLTLDEPVGVVGVITPWNFPMAIPAFKLGPALAFGNTVVWKPAEAASGSAVLLAELFVEAGLPAGVLNLITGDGKRISSSFTSDPDLAALTFTGSNSVGVSLRQAVAERSVKIQVEMGGKNPAVVLADADLDDAAVQIARGSMLSTGQRCTATSRVYVETTVFDEFCARLVRAVDAFRVGDPYLNETDIGPLATVDQHRRVADYLALAKQEGATVLTGSLEVADPATADGCFVAPTVLTNVATDSRLLTEEIFGPVVVVTECADYAETLRLSNTSKYGLSAAIFTSRIDRATDFMRRSATGLVHINRETAGIEVNVPFGGVKESGNSSSELGKAAKTFYTNHKTVYLRSKQV